MRSWSCLTNEERHSSRIVGGLLLLAALAGLATTIMVQPYGGPPLTGRAAAQEDPTATIAPTLAVTATAAITPTVTPAPTVAWVWLRTDSAMRVQLCTGLAHEAPSPGQLPPLEGCEDVVPYIGAPTSSAPGQWYILRPGEFGYRVIADPTPRPGFCEPVFVIVTATPSPSSTPTATATPDWIGTAVVGTLTALAPTPTATATPRPVDTRPTPLTEATPTGVSVPTIATPTATARPTRTPVHFVKRYVPLMLKPRPRGAR